MRIFLALLVALAFGGAPERAAAGTAANATGGEQTCGRRARRRPPAPRRLSRVAVQPIPGTKGPALRAQLARLLRGRGFPVVTSLPAVSGTAQYPGLARERGVGAFVVTELVEHPRRHSATFLVWHGESGDLADRWTVSASEKRLPSAVARGFWKRLGGALTSARTPPSGRLPPARPIRIDASSPHDEPIFSDTDVARGPRLVR